MHLSRKPPIVIRTHVSDEPDQPRSHWVDDDEPELMTLRAGRVVSDAKITQPAVSPAFASYISDLQHKEHEDIVRIVDAIIAEEEADAKHTASAKQYTKRVEYEHDSL